MQNASAIASVSTRKVNRILLDKGWTIKDLAAKMRDRRTGKRGTSYPSLCRILQRIGDGQRVRPDTAKRIADALGVEVGSILRGE